MASVACELERLDVHTWSELFRELAAVDQTLWDVWRQALDGTVGAKSGAEYRERLTEAMLAVCERRPELARRLEKRTR